MSNFDRVLSMSKQEVFDLFVWLEYLECNDHPLIRCTDFLCLLDLAFPDDSISPYVEVVTEEIVTGGV